MTDASASPEPAYQSLYRRFRPQRFAEVLGQDHVTRALRNSVAGDRVNHAYLFSGPRGTGKTSTARILAKALNCAAPVDGEPCGVCSSCVAIAAGTSFDVHEQDAASNRGIDDIRDLISRAALATPGRWKVYIVDEVHMLSQPASNALLKTLEEPPEHVVFVLATTDPQKVLPTIRSRTQHFEFHLLDEEVLESLLTSVAEQAALELPDGAIDLARRRARGSARDALSQLDQVAASGLVEDDGDALALVVQALGASDTSAALAGIAAAVRAGRDPQQLAVELIERLRMGFLGLVAPGAPGGDGPDASAAIVEARELGPARCVRSMELIGAAIVAMREAPEPRITLEVAVIRICHPEAEETAEALLDRIERLERRLAGLETGPAERTPPAAPPPPPPRARPAGRPPVSADAPAPASTETPPAAPTEVPGPEQLPEEPDAPSPPGSRPALGAFRSRPTEDLPSPPQSTSEPPPVPEPPPPTIAADEPGAAPSRDELVSAWGDQLLVGLRARVRMLYMAGRFVESEGGNACFALPNEAHVRRAEPHRLEVAEVLSDHFGRRVGLRLVIEASKPGVPPERGTPGDDPTPGPEPFGEGDQLAEAESALPEVAPGGGEEDPRLGLSWAHERLLEAFPGAEEVDGP